jgi:hypothetical protein
MEQIRIDDKQKIDKVIVTCVMDLWQSLAETKGVNGMENDFIDLFQSLLNINKKLCNNLQSFDTTKIEASEYYHNSVNYYKDDETDDEDDGGIQFVDK